MSLRVNSCNRDIRAELPHLPDLLDALRGERCTAKLVIENRGGIVEWPFDNIKGDRRQHKKGQVFHIASIQLFSLGVRLLRDNLVLELAPFR